MARGVSQRATSWGIVTAAEQMCIRDSNVTMQIDTVLYYQITDPKLFAYGVENPMNAIENLTATTLRNIIGELELEDVYKRQPPRAWPIGAPIVRMFSLGICGRPCPIMLPIPWRRCV